MKARNGFVSNSSSMSFIITNKTENDLTLADFVLENLEIATSYNKCYGNIIKKVTPGRLLASAIANNETIKIGENVMTFGDCDGTLIGKVLDYMLRDSGESKRFKWRFYTSNR